MNHNSIPDYAKSKVVFLMRHAQSIENEKKAGLSDGWSQIKKFKLPTKYQFQKSVSVLKYSPDSKLSRVGKEQVDSVRGQIEKTDFLQRHQIELIVSSTLKRSIETAEGAFKSSADFSGLRILTNHLLIERNGREMASKSAFRERVQRALTWLTHRREEVLLLVSHGVFLREFVNCNQRIFFPNAVVCKTAVHYWLEDGVAKYSWDPVVAVIEPELGLRELIPADHVGPKKADNASARRSGSLNDISSEHSLPHKPNRPPPSSARRIARRVSDVPRPPPNGPRRVSDSPRTPPNGPRRVSDSPHSPYGSVRVMDIPRTASGSMQVFGTPPEGPRRLSDSPHTPPEGPRRVSDSPGTPPEGPRRVLSGSPRPPPEGPMRLMSDSPRTPPKGPRRVSDIPRTASGSMQMFGTPPQGPRRVSDTPNSQFGSMRLSDIPRTPPEGPGRVLPGSLRPPPEGPRRVLSGSPRPPPEGPRRVLSGSPRPPSGSNRGVIAPPSYDEAVEINDIRNGIGRMTRT